MLLLDWFSGSLTFSINCMYGEDWHRLKTKKIERLRLNFSKCRNSNVASLISPVIPGTLLYKV